MAYTCGRVSGSSESTAVRPERAGHRRRAVRVPDGRRVVSRFRGPLRRRTSHESCAVHAVAERTAAGHSSYHRVSDSRLLYLGYTIYVHRRRHGRFPVSPEIVRFVRVVTTKLNDSHMLVLTETLLSHVIFRSWPSDHYFRSVRWFVCLFVCAEFLLSRL